MSGRIPITPSPFEIEAQKTESGGWTKQQLAEWGVPWPPPPRWRERLNEAHRLYQELASDSPYAHERRTTAVKK